MSGDVTLGDLIRFKKTVGLGNYNFSTNAATTAVTLAAWQFVGATAAQPILPGFFIGPDEVTIDMTGTLGAGAALTVPTAAAILAAIPNYFVQQNFKVRIKNDSAGAFAWTVTANTGVTIIGTATVAQATYRDFYVTITGAGANAAVTMQNVGSGTA